MSLARPSLPARRSSGVPPPPPPRRPSATSLKTPGTDDEVEIPEKPMGIAARIASLQLNQVGRSPMSPKPSVKAQPQEESPEQEEVPPSLPPRRKSTLPPPVLSRSPVAQVYPMTPEQEPEQEEEEEETPPSLPPRRYSTLPPALSRSPVAQAYPITPEQEPEQEEEEEETPPSLPPRRKSTLSPVQPSRRPTWKEIEVRGNDFVRAISRKPPPVPSKQPPPTPGRRLPPKPTRLPTPPPEPEPEYEEELLEEPSTGCIKCHDFSSVDDHAAQFPKETVTSLDQLAYDLTSPWESETEKFRAIFTWLHHNIAYDTEAFFGGNVQATTPEATATVGLGGSVGTVKAMGTLIQRQDAPVPQYKGNHAWNAACMDGEWRLLDSCWGAGAIMCGGQGYTKRLAPSWFISSNAEFGKKHFPEDPAHQFISDEEGGPVSWEDYILEPEGPMLNPDFHDQNFSPHYVQPSTKKIQGGTWVTFHLFKLCEHFSTAQAYNYVHFVRLDNDNRTSLTLNAEGGWSATVYIPPETVDLLLLYIQTFDGEDAKGLSVKEYEAGIGRKAMSFGVLCKWTVV
ncbi:hypothetical protein BT96DRAFT_968889 [Gymnopus androsaceus JB14]|uniref:Transglutaminase-like domain-containing protein n=1 Tax=Gymnopus androsaceus JB14 TaxID=1447944 RepID=A0A6A4IU05_9AGAR|nr:hypothetical protein BT96DRAFT_968889 [Gymnopus androsaceus JB14]